MTARNLIVEVRDNVKEIGDQLVNLVPTLNLPPEQKSILSALAEKLQTEVYFFANETRQFMEDRGVTIAEPNPTESVADLEQAEANLLANPIADQPIQQPVNQNVQNLPNITPAPTPNPDSNAISNAIANATQTQ